MNLYDHNRKQIGEVNFRMDAAVVSWQTGEKGKPETHTQHEATLPRFVFDAIARVPHDVESKEEEVERATSAKLLRENDMLRKQVQEVARALDSVRRHRSLLARIIGSVVDDGYQEFG